MLCDVFLIQFRYDVHRGSDAGIIQVLGSYFVHHFSPRGLSPLAKNVAFVVDVSGSMRGMKMEQTRQAMHTILDQLRAGDFFNILLFTDAISVLWNEASPATYWHISSAKKFFDEPLTIYAGNKTDTNFVLLMSLGILKNAAEKSGSAGNFPMVLFLTDGNPTAGETLTSKIRANVLTRNTIKASIFSLGFGFDLDFDFLRALSAENGGTARRIYTDKDATSQFEGFFDEISTPLLMKIKFKYPRDVVDETHTTALSFTQYNNGSENIVSGKLKDGTSSKIMSVDIHDDINDTNYVTYTISHTLLSLTIPSDEVLIKDFAKRLWAYMKIKELLVQLLLSDDADEQERLKSAALRLSLEYNFVTPLTSLVVDQSNNNSYLELERESGVKYFLTQTRAGDSKFTPAAIGWRLSPAGLTVLNTLSFFATFFLRF